MACITKRRGRYVIDCYDQTGKRYRKTMKAGTTKDAAKTELREIETKIERRTFMHEKKTPLFSEVKAQWLDYKKQFLRETTHETYETNCRIHLSELDNLKINRINTATIEKFISILQDKAKSTATTRKPGFIPTGSEKKIRLMTARKIIVILNQVMAYAVRHRFIDYNPVRDAERPRSQGREGEEKNIAILNPGQIRVFLENVPDQKYKTLFLAAIMTGARQGEILGLKWSDVDFTKKQISINRTFNMGRFFTPKTKGSARRIDLAPMLVKALAAWKLKSGGKDDDLVFYSVCSDQDKEKSKEPEMDVRGPMNYSNMVQRHFWKALKKAEIPRIRFHDLRHTFASLLIEQGENIKYIQSQLGHSSPTVTLNVYAHLMKGENQEAACRLEKSIFSKNRSQNGHKRKKEATA
jgi:integrase